MQKIKVTFKIDPQDAIEAASVTPAGATGNAQQNLVAILQHHLYDDPNGPQLAGNFRAKVKGGIKP